MIRTILAVVLTVAIVAVAIPGIEHAAGERGDQQARAAIADLERAAKSLYVAEETPPAGVDGARRTVTVSFPSETLTEDPLTSLSIERVDEEVSVVTYRVAGEKQRSVVVEAPVVGPNGGRVSFGEITGEQRFRLTLSREQDTGRPIIVVERL